MAEDSTKIAAMQRGGKKLARVRQSLVELVQPGVSFEEIEAAAQRLIAAEGAKPSFSTVPKYEWATCLMLDDAVCHGIPQGQILEAGSLLTIDVGLIEAGYHLDTSITVGVGNISGEQQAFLAVGRQAVKKAISRVKPGASVYDLSRAMQKTVERRGYGAVYQLTGHGIGKQLHMDPSIPCVAQRADKRIILEAGQTLAIEIMYTAGEPDLVLAADGWTYVTADGSLSGMFEETVLVTDRGYQVLTQL